MHNTKEETSHIIASDLRNMEIIEASYTKQCFSRHVHEDYCIGVIESGAQRFYAHGKDNTATHNSVILVNADQVHDGSTASKGGWTYQAMYPSEQLFFELCEDARLGSHSSPWFPEAVVDDRQLADVMRVFFFFAKQNKQALARDVALLEATSLLITRHARQRPNFAGVGKNKKAVEMVCEYLREHFHENVSLSELARLTNLNQSYLNRLFKVHTGLPPHAWQNQIRLQQSRRMIRNGISILDTAIGCGFSDQSHLNRHFRRSYGSTPGNYEKAQPIHATSNTIPL